MSEATEIGEILSVYGSAGFAVMRLDRLDEAKAPLTADNMAVTAFKPKWLEP